MTAQPIPTTTTDLTVLEYADWAPGCEEDDAGEHRAEGVDSCRMCGGGDTLLCTGHHLEWAAAIAEWLAVEGNALLCKVCGAPLAGPCDRTWRPL